MMKLDYYDIRINIIILDYKYGTLPSPTSPNRFESFQAVPSEVSNLVKTLAENSLSTKLEEHRKLPEFPKSEHPKPCLHPELGFDAHFLPGPPPLPGGGLHDDREGHIC